MKPAEHIDVDLGAQRLTLHVPGLSPRIYRVSTALAGAGERSGSMRTPRGRHIVHLTTGGADSGLFPP